MYGAGTVLTIILVAAPPSPDAIGQAQQDVLQDDAYQTAWSEEDVIRRPDSENWRRTAGDRDWNTRRRAEGDDLLDGEPPRRTSRRPNPNRERSGRGGAVLESVLWVALAIVVGLLALAFLRAWLRVPKDVAPADPKPKPKPKPAALVRPLSEAERFAAEGQYAQAAHVLLLETLAALRAHADEVPDSWTSREVQRSVSMPEAARPALGRLVETVEFSLFGARPVSADDYDACKAAFAEFRAAYEGAHA